MLAAFGSKNVKLELPANDLHLLEGEKLPLTTTTNSEEVANYIKELTIMRRMEIESDNLYKNKKIFGFCHLYDGQEAIALGLEEAVTFDDHLITAYRDHCQAYLRGISLFEIFAEMFGLQGGSSKGKGGSMHYYKAENNYYGGNGIVGAQVPVGTGLAFALKYQKKKNVCVTMYGDGASNQGQIFEAANIAALWKLPVIYICENNQYGMGTSVERAAAEVEMHKRFGGVPGITVDGLNVFAVRESLKWAKEYSIENGPIAVNIQTYRYHGHSMSDPGITYRTREEVQTYRKEKDCIKLVKTLALEKDLLTEKEIKTIEKDAKQLVASEVKRALAQPEYETSALYQDIYEPGHDSFLRAPNFEDSLFVDEGVIPK